MRQEETLTAEQALYEVVRVGRASSSSSHVLVTEQEVKPGKDLEIERSLNHSIITRYLKDCNELPLLSAKEERQLFDEYEVTRDEGLRNKIIRHNLRLVVAVVKRTSHIPMDILDKIQNGNIGLGVAVDRFRPSMGFKFSTYAVHWIKQRIYRGFELTGRTIRVPTHISTEISKLRKRERNFYKTHGRKPTDTELFEMWGYGEKELVRLRQVMDLGEEVSLNHVVALSDKLNRGLVMESHRAVSHDSLMVSIEAREELKTALAELEKLVDPVKRDFSAETAERFLFLFGISDETFSRKLPHLVAAKFGVTRQRILQHEREVLFHLKIKRNDFVRLLEKIEMLVELSAYEP